MKTLLTLLILSAATLTAHAQIFWKKDSTYYSIQPETRTEDVYFKEVLIGPTTVKESWKKGYVVYPTLLMHSGLDHYPYTSLIGQFYYTNKKLCTNHVVAVLPR